MNEFESFDERRKREELIFLSNRDFRREIREGRRSFRLYQERSDRMVTALITVAFAASIAGAGLYANKVISEVNAEKAYMAQPIYDDNTEYDVTDPYNPDNLVFDHIVKEADSPMTYRVVVNKQGDCAYVTMDYKAPFEILDEISSRQRVESLGFDFNSLSNGRPR